MNINYIKLNYDFLIKLIVFINIFIFLFLWDLNLNIDPFLFIIIPCFLIFTKKENYKLNKSYFFVFLLTYFIISLITFLNLGKFNLNAATKIAALILVTIFCIYYIKQIIFNIKYLVLLFSILYFSTNIFDLIINFQTYNFGDLNLLHWKRCHFYTGLFRQNIFFSENSHFGMIAVAITFYLIFLFSIEKNIIIKFFLVFIVFTFFYNSSTTFFVGYIASFLALFICCYKNLNKQFIFFSTLFLFVVIFFLTNSSSCMKRLEHIAPVISALNDIENITDNSTSTIVIEKKGKEFTTNYQEYLDAINLLGLLRIENPNSEEIKNLENKIKKYREILTALDDQRFKVVNSKMNHNLTTQVYIRSFFILRQSLIDKPFGWGVDNYSEASKKYRYQIPIINPSTMYLNENDASNNFVKFISEFGIFGILILILITIISLDQRIDFRTKIFFMPIIITQLIRGAGYFNGGFILAINIFIILYIYNYKNSSNVNIRN